MKVSLYGALLSAVLLLSGCNSSGSSEQTDALAPIKPWQSWAESLGTRDYNVTQDDVLAILSEETQSGSGEEADVLDDGVP